ncbi:MAG TPA: sigma-70 family RNA polymerase sigma factor [Candidatus Angelobacter sp.]|jgi:RNA polymerase sigma factor for flagellar operon FliA|nr:sigma-70 family RNA polymerase sigma factor [Candidatus Angelobacter sp.]
MPAVSESQLEAQYPLVERIANKVGRSLPRHVDRRDLVQMGMLGLLEAAGRYEPALGIDFPVFASQRIRGAIMDGLRDADSCTRNARKAGKRAEEIEQTLRLRLGREPDKEEIARALGIHLAKFERIRLDLEASKSPQLTQNEHGEYEDLIAALPAPEPEKPLFPAGAVSRYVKELEPRLGKIVQMHYFQGLKFKEIGMRMGVSESRISQLLAKALMDLRTFMRFDPNFKCQK